MKATLESPRLDPALERRVIAAMHPGLISCPLDTPLRTVARMMATYRVHAIVVNGHGTDELPDGSFWGVVSDNDLLRAARAVDFDTTTARELAATPVLTVATTDSLDRAVQTMVENEVTHVIVLEPRSLRPIGVLSTLDVARAVAALD
jgi:CBS domain-containing protein